MLAPWAMDLLLAIKSGELKLKDYHLDQWRLMHIGAQPVPAGLINEWRKIFPNPITSKTPTMASPKAPAPASSI